MKDLNNKKNWKITKLVLPQHTDHAGVLWHGAYFNFLEEARVDALQKVGFSYSDLSRKGYEIPVISAKIIYKRSFIHGEKLLLISQFNLVNKIRLNCKSYFLKKNGVVGAESMLELVVVRKKNGSIKLVRELPQEIRNLLLLLNDGPKHK